MEAMEGSAAECQQIVGLHHSRVQAQPSFLPLSIVLYIPLEFLLMLQAAAFKPAFYLSLFSCGLS